MAADRKESILESAIAMIARRGVRGLRVEEVAAEAKVAVSLIYYHFKSRDGLVRAALDRANEIAGENVSRTLRDDMTGFEQVIETLEAELADSPTVKRISIVWGEVLATAVFEPHYRDQMIAADQRWRDLIVELIAGGQRDGSIPPDLDGAQAAETLTILVDGLSSHWLAGMIERDHAVAILRRTAGSVLGRSDSVVP